MAEPVWIKNHGACPGHLRETSKRVAVKLRNGLTMGLEPLGAGSPAGWPADGDRRPTMRWTLEGGPFDVLEYTEL